MKTFLMIYNENTKELIDEYEETNDPQTTFNNWYLESDVSFEVFQNSIAFYFIGSVNIKENLVLFDTMLLIENWLLKNPYSIILFLTKA